MTDTALYYALSTIAQCAAALAALIGFLGLWRLDQLKQEREEDERDLRGRLHRMIPRFSAEQVLIEPTEELLNEAWRFADADLLAEPHPSGIPVDEMQRRQQRVREIRKRWKAREDTQPRLMRALQRFLGVTLTILVLAIVGIPFVGALHTWPWTVTILIMLASLGLAIGPAYVVREAARSIGAVVMLALLLLASPTLAGPAVRCQTHHEPTLNRLQTLCSDGTQAVSTWSPTLQQWQTRITESPRQTCTGHLNTKTRSWEGRCR